MHFSRMLSSTAILATLSSSVLSAPTTETDRAISPVENRNMLVTDKTLDAAQHSLEVGGGIAGVTCALDFEPVTKSAACVAAAVEALGVGLIGIWRYFNNKERSIAESSDPRLATNMVHNWPPTAQQSTLKQLSSSFAGERLLVAYHNCTGAGCNSVYYEHLTTTSGVPVHHLALSPRSSTLSKRQSEESSTESEGDGEPELFVDYLFYDDDESDDGAVAANTPDFTTQLGHMVDNPTFTTEGATCFDIFDASDSQDEDSYGYLAVSQNSDNPYSDQFSQFMGVCGGLSAY